MHPRTIRKLAKTSAVVSLALCLLLGASLGGGIPAAWAASPALQCNPPAPALSSPADDSAICDTTPTFRWGAVSGAITYRLVVEDDPDFGYPYIGFDELFGNVTEYTPAEAMAPDTYYWRVEAYLGGGCWSPRSPVWSFTIQDMPSAPVLSSPANGGSTCDTTPFICWGAVSPPEDRYLQVDNNNDFSSPLISVTVHQTCYTPTTPLAPGTYYWRVRVCNSCGCSPYSAVWSFTILSEPAAPALSSPAGGSSTCDGTPQFCWNEVTGADDYRLEVDDNIGFGSPWLSLMVSGACHTPATALPAGAYYWRVQACNSCGCGSYSAVRTLTIQETPATPPLSSPADGSSTCDTTPQFCWSAVSDVRDYWLQADNNSDFGSPEIDRALDTATCYTPATALAPDVYYWRVKACNACGCSSWSSVRTLTVLGPPSSPPLLSAPANGSSACDTTPEFCWGAVSGATGYTLLVDNNSDFYSPVIALPLGNVTCYTLPPGTLSPDIYYWKVTARNSCGAGPWSVVWHLAIYCPNATPTSTRTATPTRTTTVTPMPTATRTTTVVSTPTATRTPRASPTPSATITRARPRYWLSIPMILRLR